MQKTKRNAITSWIWFGLISASLPIVWGIVSNYYASGPNYHGLKYIWQVYKENIKHGELILICIPLLSIMIGELFSIKTKKNNHVRLKLCGVCLVVLVLSAFSAIDFKGSSLPTDWCGWGSLGIYSSTIICGFITKLSF